MFFGDVLYYGSFDGRFMGGVVVAIIHYYKLGVCVCVCVCVCVVLTEIIMIYEYKIWTIHQGLNA